MLNKCNIFFIIVILTTITTFGYANDERLKEYYQACCRISVSGGVGSGTIFKEDSSNYYVLTNAHVVGNARNVNLEFAKFNGDVVYYSPSIQGKVLRKKLISSGAFDVAIVQVPKQNMRGVKLPVFEISETENINKNELHIFTSGSQAGELGSIQPVHINKTDNQLIYYIPTARPGRSGSSIVDLNTGKIVGLVAWLTGEGSQSQGLAMTSIRIRSWVLNNDAYIETIQQPEMIPIPLAPIETLLKKTELPEDAKEVPLAKIQETGYNTEQIVIPSFEPPAPPSGIVIGSSSNLYNADNPWYDDSPSQPDNDRNDGDGTPWDNDPPSPPQEPPKEPNPPEKPAPPESSILENLIVEGFKEQDKKSDEILKKLDKRFRLIPEKPVSPKPDSQKDEPDSEPKQDNLPDSEPKQDNLPEPVPPNPNEPFDSFPKEKQETAKLFDKLLQRRLDGLDVTFSDSMTRLERAIKSLENKIQPPINEDKLFSKFGTWFSKLPIVKTTQSMFSTAIWVLGAFAVIYVLNFIFTIFGAPNWGFRTISMIFSIFKSNKTQSVKTVELPEVIIKESPITVSDLQFLKDKIKQLST